MSTYSQATTVKDSCSRQVLGLASAFLEKGAKNLKRFYQSDADKQTQEFFDSLVRIHSSYLFRYAYWLCHNRALAEDLVQETFLRAWKSIHQLRDPAVVRSWLTTILRREHARLYDRSAPEVDADLFPDTLPGPKDNDASEEAFALHEALARLHRKYREPLLLQVLGGFSLEDIAGICGITSSAAAVRVFRARQKLRYALCQDTDTTQ